MFDYTNFGLSGCILELMSDTVIRKTSQSVGYNHRFEKQIQKQKFFSNINVPNILIPRIIDVGYINNLMYFDMEYIENEGFNDTFKKASFTNITHYSNMMSTFIDHTRTNRFYETVEIKQIIIDKLKSLHPKSKYSSLINDILLYVYTLNFDEVEKNPCHGDFTLSNMLFVNDTIYLIDFLDSYIESFLIDLVKIKQDLYYKWTMRMTNSYSTKTEFSLNTMWSDIQRKYANYIDTEIFHVLDFINYIRIEPYITTPYQYQILDETIKLTKLYQKYKRN